MTATPNPAAVWAAELADEVIRFYALVEDRAQKGWLKTPRPELARLVALARLVEDAADVDLDALAPKGGQ